MGLKVELKGPESQVLEVECGTWHLLAACYRIWEETL